MRKGPSKQVAVVASGEAVTREYLGGLLRGQGWELRLAESAGAAERALAGRGADLLVLDADLTGEDESLCARLREAAEGYLPVLLLTQAHAEAREAGFRIGADDLLAKPVHEAELLERARRLMALRAMHQEVVRSREDLARATVRDAATGLYDDGYAARRLREELRRAERYRESLACVLVDLDQREAFRAAGDGRLEAAMKELASRALGTVREVDLAARRSRGEVLLLLPCTHVTGALAVAERLGRAVDERPAVLALPECSGALELSLQCTMGISVYPSLGIKTPDTLLGAATGALVEARRSGSQIAIRQHEGYLFRPPRG
ncbi:MAG: diguanylate cyclase [Myxococcota bacterium]